MSKSTTIVSYAIRVETAVTDMLEQNGGSVCPGSFSEGRA
jgi:hypothetical protein